MQNGRRTADTAVMNGEREIRRRAAVAIDRDKNSRYALRYAVGKSLVPRDEVIKLIHVKQRGVMPGACHRVPSTEFVEQPACDRSTDLFIPFRCFCICRKMESDVVVLADHDVAMALVEYVRCYNIEMLFLGAPSRGSFSRLFKKADVATTVMKMAPGFCSVYVVGKGKVTSVRSATRPIIPHLLPPQQHHPQLHSRISPDEVEDKLSMSSGRSSTDGDFFSFYENLETGILSPLGRGGEPEELRCPSLHRSST